MEYLTHPIAILFYIVVVLAVVLPWLKKRAEKTETVTDDRILTYIQIILSEVARKIMGVKFLFLIVISTAMLQSCVFSGAGIKYETGNYLAMTAQDGDKSFNVVMSVKEDPKTLDEMFEKIESILERWID